MAVTPGNFAMGPGSLYIGTFGAAEPADSAINTTPAASAWTDCGGTLGGITFEFGQEIKKLECDQLTYVPESRVIGNTIIVKTKLAEVTLTNLTNAMNGGTSGSGSGYETYEPDMGDSSNSPDYKALIFDGFGAGGLRRRVIVRKVINVESVELESSKDGQQAYAVSLEGHYVSSAIAPYKVVQAVSV